MRGIKYLENTDVIDNNIMSPVCVLDIKCKPRVDWKISNEALIFYATVDPRFILSI